jgi:glycosyltransferase involved in cell wall biosynthesis
VDLALACQLADVERYGRLAPGATIVPGPIGLGHRSERLAWEQSGLPVLAEQVGADVIHMPNYSMPLRPGRPTVVTIHDLAFFTDPERYAPMRGMSLKSATKTAARQATRLIVPSNATRDELVRVLGTDSGRIDVAHHGVDHRLFHRPDEAQISRVTARLGLHGKPYVAFLGSLAPRKNAPSLVAGWAEAVSDLPEPPALVLGGGGGWSQELDEAVARVPSRLRLVRPGYLPFADLTGFLGGALVVAAPSRGEGFGLPVLEAMQCGAPVIASRAVEEAAGGAALYASTAEELAQAMREVARNFTLAADLRARSLQRAAEFSWDRAARLTHQVYEEARRQYGR